MLGKKVSMRGEGGTSLAEQEGLGCQGAWLLQELPGSVWVPLGAASGSRLMPSSLHKGSQEEIPAGEPHDQM